MISDSSTRLQLAIRLLGGFEAEIMGVPVHGLQRREGERLLAYLTLHPGETIAYSALARLFWPAEVEANAGLSSDYPNTRQAVRALRLALGSEAARLNSPSKGCVRFDWADADVNLFDRYVQGEKRDLWQTALSLYRGELLPGWDESWVLEARARRKRSYERVLKLLLLDARAGNEAALEENCLRRMVVSSPDAEIYWRDLLQLLNAQRRFAEMEESIDVLRFQTASRNRSLEATTVEWISALQTQRETAAPAADRRTEPATGSGSTKPREAAGGAVPLESQLYILRPTDQEFQASVALNDSIVLVKGARQMGKTSLLARGLEEARKAGNRVAFTDFQTFNAAQMASTDSLFLAMATGLAVQLDLDMAFRREWDPDFGAGLNLEMFLRQQVFQTSSQPVVWGMDEVDRLFACPFRNEVFGLFRSWHNRRAVEPSGPWSLLTLAMAYATEAHLFITDMNQSPFNVGTRLALQDFTLEQTGELNRRYGSPLPNTETVSRFHKLIGGQPYLAQCGLAEVARGQYCPEDLLSAAEREDGPFGEHLRRLLTVLLSDPDMAASLREVLQGHPCSSRDHFYRLRSAGLLVGEWNGVVRLRCPLYQAFLAPRL
jgi:DNA-binding SARP family transcriptional activator